mmetsp:Transcript_9943/g.42297  ORF Transcript_9943/g.42297 Transcript_9943/m.42297 type:complete len:327 (+) Transcript_9943:1126-2106(+)
MPMPVSATSSLSQSHSLRLDVDGGIAAGAFDRSPRLRRRRICRVEFPFVSSVSVSFVSGPAPASTSHDALSSRRGAFLRSLGIEPGLSPSRVTHVPFPSRSIFTRTSPPSRVYFTELLATLMSACRNRNLSPRTVNPHKDGSRSMTISTWFRLACWPTMSTSSFIISSTSNDSKTSVWCVSDPDSSLAKSKIWPMIPSRASALTIAEPTNSRCASVNDSSSSRSELNAMMELRGVRNSCEMFATNARCNCETLSASIFAFSSVRAASCEYRETSRASVKRRSSRRINPSAALMSQKLENTNIVLYVIFATISAPVINMNCVTVFMS